MHHPLLVGLSVLGDYNTGRGASLVMPGAGLTVSIGGNLNAANYDMARAELRTVGLGGAPQTLEVMSTDIGPAPAGLDRTRAGHFPVGTLELPPIELGEIEACFDEFVDRVADGKYQNCAHVHEDGCAIRAPPSTPAKSTPPATTATSESSQKDRPPQPRGRLTPRACSPDIRAGARTAKGSQGCRSTRKRCQRGKDDEKLSG